jgi:hypothetical protein
MSVLRRVREVIAKRFGPAYKVDTFGSVKFVYIGSRRLWFSFVILVRYGAVSPKSDMDLIILVSLPHPLFGIYFNVDSS